MRQVDLDRDGYIGESDLDAFIGRVNFQEFFEGMNGVGSRGSVVMSAEKTSNHHSKYNPSSEMKLNSRSGMG